MERIVGRTVGLLPAELGLLYARWHYGVDLRRANLVDAVRSSIVPVLLIHGEDNINILPWHARALAQADPVHAQLWLVPGAGHCGAVGVAPDDFGLEYLISLRGTMRCNQELPPKYSRRRWLAPFRNDKTKEKPRIITPELLALDQRYSRHGLSLVSSRRASKMSS